MSTVAHELRTPLTGLGGYVELILSGNVDDAAVEREFLERCRDIVARWTSSSATCWSCRGSSPATCTSTWTPSRSPRSCQRVMDHLAPIALQRSVQLRSQLPPRLRAARGDRRRVEQILKNLLGNALKFTPAGGTVELTAWFDGPVSVIAVRDDGLGIADEDRARIFERFFRMASHERINGTGLGLPIARELARAMGGDLDVASVQRAGSAFVLVLPGPTAVDAPTMTAVLDRTLDAEHTRLQDQGMLRRLQHLGREAATRTSSPGTGTARPPGRGDVAAVAGRRRTSPSAPSADRSARPAARGSVRPTTLLTAERDPPVLRRATPRLAERTRRVIHDGRRSRRSSWISAVDTPSRASVPSGNRIRAGDDRVTWHRKGSEETRPRIPTEPGKTVMLQDAQQLE